MTFLSQKFKTNLFIRYFGLFKVPLIFYCKPKIINISEESVTLKIPLFRIVFNRDSSPNKVEVIKDMSIIKLKYLY